LAIPRQAVLSLFSSAFIALVISNSPWGDAYHHFWETTFTIGFGDMVLSKSLHHWINDGLMAVFFFVVGLELKREIVAGELSDPKNAVLPIGAAIAGMVVPALIFTFFNFGGDGISGWGIPMATDIAFALGVLYLLGDRVPVSLKIFLTALAIADDIGAVLVIAFFYTSDIHLWNVLIGFGFMGVLMLANILGFRNTLFYAVLGIGGLWLAFLLSGVHATIAAVLAAFTIPVRVKASEVVFSEKLSKLHQAFKEAKPNNQPTITSEQLHILEEIEYLTKKAQTPLQRLEHRMHPLVAFGIMPDFCFGKCRGPTTGRSITRDDCPGICRSLFRVTRRQSPWSGRHYFDPDSFENSLHARWYEYVAFVWCRIFSCHRLYHVIVHHRSCIFRYYLYFSGKSRNFVRFHYSQYYRIFSD
jgi:Na+:H+ antiporter, NhaA family